MNRILQITELLVLQLSTYQNKLNHHIERNFRELEDFLTQQSKLGSQVH
jgi:hypothetical protein